MALRTLCLALLFAVPAFAQDAPAKVIVVPVPSDAPDAGAISSEPAPPAGAVEVPVPQEPPPQQPVAQPPPEPPPAPPATPPAEAAPAPPPAEPIDPSLLPPEKPRNVPGGAMLDGHPREGAFLAGPGSLAFIVHHTLWGSAGVLATQMVPRFQGLALIGDFNRDFGDPARINPYTLLCSDPNALADICNAGDADDRTAYLTGGLIGAGVGFAASAIWQFTHWLDTPAVTAGFLHGVYGALFLAGFSGFFTGDTSAIAWLSFIGSEAAAWASIILGGGELPANKVLFISTGAFWATAFTGLLLGIIGTAGGGADVRTSLNVLFLAPGIGALATGLFSLKYSPSVGKVMRANLFGVLAGSAVFLVSGLVLGANFLSPVPYVLAPIASAGAITIVSLLWADAAESPTTPGDGAAKARAKDDLWWW